MNSFKLVYDRDVKVYDRATGKECVMKWFGSDGYGANEGYASADGSDNCNIIIKRRGNKIETPKSMI